MMSKRTHDVKDNREGLGVQERARYLEKLRFIGGNDLYELAPTSWTRDDPAILPSLTYPDIVNYLVFSPSPYRAEDLKSYKGLEAYNHMMCGWVRETQDQVINDHCAVKAKTCLFCPGRLVCVPADSPVLPLVSSWRTRLFRPSGLVFWLPELTCFCPALLDLEPLGGKLFDPGWLVPSDHVLLLEVLLSAKLRSGGAYSIADSLLGLSSWMVVLAVVVPLPCAVSLPGCGLPSPPACLHVTALTPILNPSDWFILSQLVTKHLQKVKTSLQKLRRKIRLRRLTPVVKEEEEVAATAGVAQSHGLLIKGEGRDRKRGSSCTVAAAPYCSFIQSSVEISERSRRAVLLQSDPQDSRKRGLVDFGAELAARPPIDEADDGLTGMFLNTVKVVLFRLEQFLENKIILTLTLRRLNYIVASGMREYPVPVAALRL
ncbi:uncharacterized protein V6R79_023899 [Siganus canaliculatus]